MSEQHCYSMQSRSMGTGKRSLMPGPNHYLLPSSLGPKVPNKPAAAAYSIGGKPVNTGSPKFNNMPGPNQYGEINSNIYKKSSPSFTIKGRLKPPPVKAFSPGPAAYNPNFGFGLKGTPSFTFRIKTKSMPLITPEDMVGYRQ